MGEALENQGAESLRNGSKGLKSPRGVRLGLISCTEGFRLAFSGAQG